MGQLLFALFLASTRNIYGLDQHDKAYSHTNETVDQIKRR